MKMISRKAVHLIAFLTALFSSVVAEKTEAGKNKEINYVVASTLCVEHAGNFCLIAL